VTPELGKGPARAGDAVPRQRGGAHAAAKTSRFRRKSGSAASDSASPAPSAPPAPQASAAAKASAATPPPPAAPTIPAPAAPMEATAHLTAPSRLPPPASSAAPSGRPGPGPGRLAPRGRPGRGAGRPGPAAGQPGRRLPGRRSGAAARAYRRHYGARGARRAGDGGRALDADRGGPRRSGRTGAGLHRKAPDRYQTRSGPESGPGIAPGADRARSRAARRSPGRETRSIMGKLTAVANRIVDRGELCVCPVKERRCQSTLSS